MLTVFRWITHLDSISIPAGLNVTLTVFCEDRSVVPCSIREYGVLCCDMVCLYNDWFRLRRQRPISKRERVELRLLCDEFLNLAKLLLHGRFRPSFKKHKMTEAGDSIEERGSGVYHDEQQVSSRPRPAAFCFMHTTA